MSNCDDDEDCEGSGAGGTGNKHSVCCYRSNNLIVRDNTKR